MALALATTVRAGVDTPVTNGSGRIVDLKVLGVDSPRNAADNAAYQESLAEAYDRPAYAVSMLGGVRTIDNPRLMEMMLADVESLAKLRAERRARCKIVVISQGPGDGQSTTYRAIGITRTPQAPLFRETGAFFGTAGVRVRWKFACAGSPPDDFTTDTDGKPLPGFPGYTVRRDTVSLWFIGNTTIPGVEARLAPLLADLTLLPEADWSAAGGKPGDIAFPPIDIPVSVLKLLRQRNASPGGEVLGQILARYENDASVWSSRLDNAEPIRTLLELAAMDSSRESNQLLARWIPMVMAGRGESGVYIIFPLIEALGNAMPEDQVDFDAIRNGVFKKLPWDRGVGIQVSQAFDRAEARTRALREPSAESLAIWMGNPSRVAYLIAHGAKPEPVKQGAKSPLQVAAWTTPANVRLMLDLGAIIDYQDRLGYTALAYAVQDEKNKPEDRTAIVALLLSRGASVKIRNEAGETPLRFAVRDPQSVGQLIAAGAEIDAADRIGCTPLYHAVSWGYAETVRRLLDAGADPNRKTLSGDSPYNNSRGRQRPDIVAMLQAHGGRLSPRQMWDIAVGYGVGFLQYVIAFLGLLLGGPH
jgi:Ankyrin repeats (3 copies)